MAEAGAPGGEVGQHQFPQAGGGREAVPGRCRLQVHCCEQQVKVQAVPAGGACTCYPGWVVGRSRRAGSSPRTRPGQTGPPGLGVKWSNPIDSVAF